MHETRTNGPATAPTYENDSRWHLVERILNSREFQRSPRLSDFLRHVCQLALEGQEHKINEQYLGETLFGRAPQYDSTSDTIVRSHALRLRRRLEFYFQREGKDEPLHLVIPRGGYVPLFMPAPQNMLPAIEDPATPLPYLELSETSPKIGVGATPLGLVLEGASPKSKEPAVSKSGLLLAALQRHWILATLLACFVVVLLSLTSYQWYALHKRGMPAGQDRDHPLWNRLFNTEEPTQIVLGDSGLVLFHAATHQYVSLHDYLNNDFSKELHSVQHVDSQFALFLAGRRYTSWTDALAATRLLRLPEARPDRTIVSFSRDMHLDDFKNGNVVIIGAQEAVPWVELFERQMDFVFSTNTPNGHGVFLNRHPLSGEPAVYVPQEDSSRQIYAVIAFLPNLQATGNVLLLEGSNMAGTEAAVDFVTDNQQLLPTLRKMELPDGSLPHFEIVLATNVVKDSPTPPQVISIHVHR